MVEKLRAAPSGAVCFWRMALVPWDEEKETECIRQGDPFDTLAEVFDANRRQRVLIEKEPGEQQNVPRHRLGKISSHDHKVSE